MAYYSDNNNNNNGKPASVGDIHTPSVEHAKKKDRKSSWQFLMAKSPHLHVIWKLRAQIASERNKRKQQQQKVAVSASQRPNRLACIFATNYHTFYKQNIIVSLVRVVEQYRRIIGLRPYTCHPSRTAPSLSTQIRHFHTRRQSGEGSTKFYPCHYL